jgi:hypothetical protein
MSWLSELFGGGDSSTQGAVPGSPTWLANEAALKAKQEADYQASLERAAAETQRIESEKANTAMMNQLFAPTELDTRLQQQQLQQIDTEAERNRLRQEALGRVSSTFAPEFERTSLPSTFDDPYIASAYASERGKVDEYLNNLLKRNVITQSGFAGGQAAAEQQAPGVRTQLADVGESLLAAQRGNLTDIANRARGAASTLDIGQTFDPSIYAKEAETSGTEFGQRFGDLYSARAPKDLFDLSALQQRAGAAQGPQNLAFDPAATQGAGITGQEEPVLPLPKKRTTAVF